MVKRPRLPFRIPFFRIFYSTTYTTLFLIILILLAITPATLIYTALRASAYQYVFEVGGVYVLVIVFTLFIYSSRLYTNRSVLAAVGKSWIPVQPGEVSKNVRKEVVKAANRSARIAFETKPRNLQPELARNKKLYSDSDHSEPTTVGNIVHIDPHHPPWGRVSHAGWSSPSELDANLAPHIQFRTVVMELPNLIEARAVSLAPPLLITQDATATPESRIVNVLSRKPTADMRSYLAQLSGLGLIPPDAGQDFVQRYEHARFSPIPMNEDEFEDLMSAFATLLANMNQLPPKIIDMARAGSDVSSETSSLSSISSRSDSISSSIAGSVFRARTPGSRLPSFYTPRASMSVARTPSPSTRRAAPFSTPRPHTSQTAKTVYRTPSEQTFSTMNSVRRTAPNGRRGMADGNGSPTASLHRLESSESGQSVIRTPLPSSSATSYYG
ncbi:unnamed protein product [Aureobasidium uvarum]|uniref:Defect at low temperature protein 1 n=1 Tax=Aureobasidium uvarum TaxID=2773716 RepID=A0A9N8PWQ9_9PEZI|nr:unnamed protein product [Aureobasidium uvarum]